MTKIKLVKCTLRSPGEAPNARFVPLREFQLWKYYMTHAHEKIVDGEEISIWVDADSYGEQPPTQARPLEAVVRVDLQYWNQKLNTATFIQRYFPLEDYDTIRDTFLRHFPDRPASAGSKAREKTGHGDEGLLSSPEASPGSGFLDGASLASDRNSVSIAS